MKNKKLNSIIIWVCLLFSLFTALYIMFQQFTNIDKTKTSIFVENWELIITSIALLCLCSYFVKRS